jgi:hypothetical protein
VSLIGTTGCASAPGDVPVQSLEFPAPDTGPGRPVLERAARRHIDDGWQALIRSNPTAAKNSASEAGSNIASELLELQAEFVGGDSPVQALRDLTAQAPDYAAAWLTLSVTAETAGDEALALQAAERGASLWPDTRWVERSEKLRTRLIDKRIEAASDLLDHDDPSGALTTLAPALALDPTNREGVLLKAGSLIALDELDRAEAALAGLPRDRDVVMLSGSIAESRGDTAAAIRIYSTLGDDPDALLKAIAIAEDTRDWQTAMSLYSSLPDDSPEKAGGLREAKLRWRVSVMPSYVQEAFSTTDVTRSDLAVIVVTLAPAVETLPSKQVPLLSDIVDMPSQREIVTATRLGLIGIDPLEHRFEPRRPVTEAEVRHAITALGRLLELPTPEWCSTTMTQPCLALTPPIAGDRVVDVIIDMIAGESA